MRCIFCKEDSSNSRSREHIIPESLGNWEHILEPGIVCDSCNNYFAIKIEKPLLETSYFKQLRFANKIYSKKGKIPSGYGITGGGLVELHAESFGLSIVIDDPNIMKNVLSGKAGRLYIPMGTTFPKNDQLFSRFLGKVAIEMLAKKFCKNEGWEREIVDKSELDPIRTFVRYSKGVDSWQYNIREIYPPHQLFYDESYSTKSYQVLHECDFVYTRFFELFFVLALCGVEFAINLGRPEVSPYQGIIIKNMGESILDIKDKRIKVQK